MYAIKAYYVLNFKALIKDKLSLFWSLFVPALILISNAGNGVKLQSMDMRWFWAYIIFNYYIYGLGLNCLQSKTTGSLKTAFSIKNSALEFFIANLLTQITFSFISIFIFNIVAAILNQVNFLSMTMYSTILIVLSIPVGFLCFNITLLNKISYNSMSTLVNVASVVCLMFIRLESPINIINPLRNIASILLMRSPVEIISYIIISLICIGTGLYSTKKYSAISNEVR